MSEEVKDTGVKDVEVTEEKKEAKFQYGMGPSLIINMVKETRVYRFEMPIGAHLDECEEACLECVNIVKKMKEESLKKQEEEKAKKEDK